MSEFIPTVSSPLDVSDLALIRQVAERMSALGFDENMHVAADGTYHPDSPAVCLARCFVIDAPTPEPLLRQHVGTDLVDVCFRLGLLSRRGELATGAVCILPSANGAHVFDYSRPSSLQEMRHFVMGPGGTTHKLIGSIPKRRFERFLDLCSGSGSAALSVAPHAGTVVAADYNERALNLARFAVAWNGFQHVDVRFTDRFSGVADQTFDMIACNPPFVVNPSNASMFLSAGMGGDTFSEQIVRGLPAHLCEGGFAHLLCDVVATANQPPPARLAEWVAGSECDAMFFASPPKGPREYAESWIPPNADQNEPGYREERARWIQYYHDSGFVAFQRFLVVLRKRAASSNWTHGIEMPNVQDNYGHHILRLFANEDLLRSGEQALLASRPKLTADTRLIVQFQPGGRTWIPENSLLRLTGGLDHEANIPNVLGLAAAKLDGSITVAEFVESLAPQVAGDDAQSIRAAILDAVTQLFQLGFLS